MEMQSLVGSKSGKIVSWFLGFAIFLLLPAFLLDTGLARIWERQTAGAEEALFDRLENILLRIRHRSAADEYFGDLLRAVGRIMRMPDTAEHPYRERLRRVVAALHTRFPGRLRIIVTDNTGNQIPELSTPGMPNSVLRKFHLAVRTGRDHLREHEKNWPVIRAFIGENMILSDIYRQYKLFEVGSGNQWRWFGHATNEQGSFLLHVSHSPDWGTLSIRDQVALFQRFRPSSPFQTGLLDVGVPGHADAGTMNAIDEFQRTAQSRVRIGDFMYCIFPLNASERLWIRTSASSLPDPGTKIGNFRLMAGILLAILAGISFHASVINPSFFVPIAVRLVFLFLYVTALPMGVLLFSEWEYIDQFYKTKTREEHDTAERLLLAFDNRYSLLFHHIEKELETHLGRAAFDTPERQRSLKRLLTVIHRRFATKDLNVLDKTGALLIRNLGPELVGQGDPRWGEAGNIGMLGRILGNIVQSACAQVNREDASFQADMTAMLADSLPSGFSAMNFLVKDLGRIVEFGMGRDRKWFCLIPLRRDGKITHMVSLFWNRDELERFYLQREIPRLEKLYPRLRIRATFRGLRKTLFPSGLPFDRRMQPIAEAVHDRQGTVLGKFRYLGRQMLATAVKPREMTDHYLFAFYDDRLILWEIGRLQGRMARFILGMLAISIFIGLILARRFLRPIGLLSQGVNAVERRNFSFRLPPIEPDELGQLGSMFNRVMGGLSDLEVGRIVQDSLFPNMEIASPPMRVFGVSHTASELGGDYFDLKVLPDGQILILIGDVSGHGVPAALVMAMAKALIESFLRTGFSLDQSFIRINEILFSVMKRRRIMTCFMGLLDPRTGIFTYTNAGHNYPYLFRPGEPPLEIKMTGSPLGCRATFVPKIDRLEIRPGDYLLFYTDGLVETETGKDACIGYEGIMTLNRFFDPDLTASCERIWQWNRSVCISATQEDDITLVLLTCDSPRGAETLVHAS